MAFGAKIIIHVMYDDDESADEIGHTRQSHARLQINDPNFFKDKEAFLGMILDGADKMWERMDGNNEPRDSE